MILAFDANIPVGLLLRRRGSLLADARLELHIAAYAWEETERHLLRRVQGMLAHGRIEPSAAETTLRDALVTGQRLLVIVPAAEYRQEEATARRRMSHDATDWHTIAVALTIGGAIWTEDHHFHGCGIACWTTETLTRELAAPAGR